jgi:hypothetical protein
LMWPTFFFNSRKEEKKRNEMKYLYGNDDCIIRSLHDVYARERERGGCRNQMGKEKREGKKRILTFWRPPCPLVFWSSSMITVVVVWGRLFERIRISFLKCSYPSPNPPLESSTLILWKF